MSDKQHHHGILDSLKSMVVDETPETPAAPVSTPAAATPTSAFSFNSFGSSAAAAPAYAPAPQASASTSLSSFMPSSTAPGPEAEDFYQKLLAKTNFDTSEVAQTIQKFIAPLQNLITDRNMLFKAGVANAKAQAGVSEDAILAVFDSLIASLSQAEESFKTKAAAFEAKEITARTQRLSDISAQITSLQAEQQQVATDLSEAQAKSARTQSGFNSALQRRAAEIDAQKAQTAAMLK